MVIPADSGLEEEVKYLKQQLEEVEGRYRESQANLEKAEEYIMVLQDEVQTTTVQSTQEQSSQVSAAVDSREGEISALRDEISGLKEAVGLWEARYNESQGNLATAEEYIRGVQEELTAKDQAIAVKEQALSVKDRELQSALDKYQHLENEYQEIHRHFELIQVELASAK